MRIAINTRFLITGKMEGFGWYTYEVTKRLVENNPDHQFILFFDRPFDPRFVFGKNVTPVVLSPQARHPILFKIWFNYSVTRALKKYRADVFFSPDGYLSLKTDIPQVAVIHDINFEHFPEDLPKTARKYLRKYFPKFARKATKIITVSEYSKSDLVKTYGVPPEKITASWNGASDVFKPISEAKKSEVRNVVSNGQPYFLFVGALHPRKNLKRLLNAYEAFINLRPDSPYRLVIVGEEMWKGNSSLSPTNEAVKARISFTGHVKLENLAEIMAAAAIFTFVPYFEGFGIPLVEAMKSGTPVLCGDKTSLPEVGGDAVMYCDPFDEKDILDKLIQLVDDTALQEKLREKGLERGKLFSWDRTANDVWTVLSDVGATNA